MVLILYFLCVSVHVYSEPNQMKLQTFLVKLGRLLQATVIQNLQLLEYRKSLNKLV